MNETTSKTTVTIKYGKGYDAAWAVFNGENPEEVKLDIISYFALPDELLHASPHEVTLHAQAVAVSTGTVGTVLGGKPVTGSENTSSTSTTTATNSPQAGNQEKPVGNQRDTAKNGDERTLLERVEAVTNKAQGNKLFKDFRAQFKTDKKAMDALTAKMRSYN